MTPMVDDADVETGAGGLVPLVARGAVLLLILMNGTRLGASDTELVPSFHSRANLIDGYVISPSGGGRSQRWHTEAAAADAAPIRFPFFPVLACVSHYSTACNKTSYVMYVSN